MASEYICGCDVGSTYGKCVIVDIGGRVLGTSTVLSAMDPEETAKKSIEEAINKVSDISDINDFAYMVGTGYGRNRVPFANQNISEISCHAMGVHITNSKVRTILDIGGQDIKGITIDADGSVKNFVMNDKCAAGTGRFLDNISRTFGMTLDEFSELSLSSRNPIPITSQCSVFAESEVISLAGQKKDKADIASGIIQSLAKRCYTMLLKSGIEEEITVTGGAAKNKGLIASLQKVIRCNIAQIDFDPQLIGALGAAEYGRRKILAKG